MQRLFCKHLSRRANVLSFPEYRTFSEFAIAHNKALNVSESGSCSCDPQHLLICITKFILISCLTFQYSAAHATLSILYSVAAHCPLMLISNRKYLLFKFCRALSVATASCHFSPRGVEVNGAMVRLKYVIDDRNNNKKQQHATNGRQRVRQFVQHQISNHKIAS